MPIEIAQQSKRAPQKPQPKETNPFDMEDESAQGLAFVEKKRAIEQRTLDSTNKSLGNPMKSITCQLGTFLYLCPFKSAGLLYEMNSTLRINKNEINRLKSVFGCVKNFLSGNQNKTLTTANKSSRGANSNTENESPTSSTHLPTSEGYENHPVSNLREDPSSCWII